jgi:hypothetical protein
MQLPTGLKNFWRSDKRQARVGSLSVSPKALHSRESIHFCCDVLVVAGVPEAGREKAGVQRDELHAKLRRCGLLEPALKATRGA